jgi:hypothetical protein
MVGLRRAFSARRSERPGFSHTAGFCASGARDERSGNPSLRVTIGARWYYTPAEKRDFLWNAVR